jgi:hypothetical protein
MRGARRNRYAQLRMKTRQASRRGKAPHSGSGPLIPLKVFIGYADLPAFRRATASVGEAMRNSGRRVELHPMLWRFEQLTSAHWGERAISAALEAHIVVLASSTSAALTPAVENWVSGFLDSARGRRTTLVVISSPADAWTISIEQPARKAKSGVLPVASVTSQKLVA